MSTQSDDAPDRDWGLREIVGHVVRGRRRRMAIICAVSVAIGLAEAAVLLIAARTAFALTEPGREVALTLGPIGDINVGVPGLIGIALVVVVLKLVAQLWVARANVRMVADMIRRHRQRLVGAFLAASWALQSEERQGNLQELIAGFTMQKAAALSAVLSLGVAGCTFAGMMVTALAVNTLGACAAALVVRAGLGDGRGSGIQVNLMAGVRGELP